ncbi:hypothetical protein EC988_004340, partial [Linderina pennispora]
MVSESTPLLMEYGKEFFATPKKYPKHAKSPKRRVCTEPAVAVLETLAELDSETERQDDPRFQHLVCEGS